MASVVNEALSTPIFFEGSVVCEAGLLLLNCATGDPSPLLLASQLGLTGSKSKAYWDITLHRTSRTSKCKLYDVVDLITFVVLGATK